MLNQQLISENNVISDKRLYYIDWLRVLAIIVVFLIHTGKIFDYHTTVVVNEVRSPSISAFRDFCLMWVMPLFFVLSGGAAFLSGKTVKNGGFIKTRFFRLVIPLLFIGTFVINPVYVYIERLSAGLTDSGFFNWYPQFFSGFYGFGGNMALLGNGTYLWYLEFLFLFSVWLYPLFKKSEKTGKSILSKLSVFFEKPAALLLLFIPVSLSSVFFEVIGLGGIRGMGGWDLISYLMFYCFGYMLYSNRKIMESINKYYPVFLTAAGILIVLYLDTHFGFILKIPGFLRHDIQSNGVLLPLDSTIWTVVLAMKGLISWCFIIGLIGLFNRYMNFKNKILSYANEALIVFYILHHAVVYSIGYYITQMGIAAELKFLIIAAVSFIIIIAVYEILIKRINPARFLFGMKRKNTA